MSCKVSFNIFINFIAGRNLCPISHPFAYDYGKRCCNSPIADVPNDFPKATDSEKRTRLLGAFDEFIRSSGTDTCLGESTRCPGLGFKY